MNIKYNILPLFAAVSLLTACSDDDIDRVYTVGEADNAIVLKVGVSEGSGTQIATRGVDDNHNATDKTDGSNVYGGGHTPFKTTGTKLALRIDGTWTGKDPISQTTSVTLKASDNQHNPIDAMDPVRYWDDYGTADPDNTAGRTAGLTIYGIGVDGYETAVPSSWTSVVWDVNANNATGSPLVIDQSGSNYWLAKDLLTSNNIHVEETNKDYDGTYKFDDYLSDKNNSTKQSSNILEFTHAMTKITVQLTAGEGFPRTDAENPSTAHFESAPTVTLEGFYYTGTVSVEAKTSTPTADATANIKMHLNGEGNVHTATFDALVFPGNAFADDTQILTFTADGNTLHVTAEKLNAAIQSAITNKETTKYPGNDNTLLQAWNYLLKITVKKTDLDITATILDWKTVEADEVEPKINVTSTYGYTVEEGGDGVSAFTKDYDLFRSTARATGYDEDNDSSNGIQYAARYSSSAWDKTIYWPNHQTHYFFRGVYPQVGTAVSGTNVLTTTEAVTTVNGNDVIAVANAAYTVDTYPSDLAIAIPRKVGTNETFDETCKDAGHDPTPGICATEGVINMNFEYVMSKVQFSLRSTGTATLGNIVDLNYVKVEIIDGFTQGKIRLSDGLHENYGTRVNNKYQLHRTTYAEDYYTVTTLDAIVPQELSDDVLVRISILDSDDRVLDVYEAQLNKIKVKTDNNTGALITEWLPGNYYKYYLDINKTAINVTATLTDWVTVEASDEVWF